MPKTICKTFRSTPMLFALSLTLLAGCHKGPQDGVVATVNGHPIQRSDLDKAYDAQMANNPQQTISTEQANSTRLQILGQLISAEIVEQRAAKLNLTATDAEVDTKLTEMKAPYTEEDFNARLKASGRTLEALRHEIRRNLTIQKLFNKEVNSKITITDADVSSYYDAHKAEYNLIDTRYHLAGVQVSGGPAPDPGNLQNSKASSEMDAKKKIQALKDRLDAGADFGAIAMNFSENPQTAPNGGDMGFVYEKDLQTDPEVYAAISKLKAGESTEILPMVDKSTHKAVGYGIYKLISKDAPGQRDLKDPIVLQSIRQQLHDVRSELLKAAFLEVLRNEAKIQNFLAEDIVRDTAK